jgi:hypothetical protein
MTNLSNIIIEPKGEKGRVFQAKLVSFIRADNLTPESNSNKIIRPVWAMFAGSQDELRPFMANLRLGRVAKESNRSSFEFLKSIRWKIIYQKEPEGVLATIYHPELFEMDPGMVDPKRIDFVILVDQEWKSKQDINIDKAKEYLVKVNGSDDLLTFLPIAPLFALYLDRRTRCPLINDELFYFHLLLMALKNNLASIVPSGGHYLYSYSKEFVSPYHGCGHEGLERLNSESLTVSCNQSDFETFLAEQVLVFYNLGL